MSEDRITGQRAGWQDIATAPRDGTVVLMAGKWSSPESPSFGEWTVWPFGWGSIYSDGDESKCDWRSGLCPRSGWAVDWVKWQPMPDPPEDADDIAAGLEALKGPVVATWPEVKTRLRMPAQKEDGSMIEKKRLGAAADAILEAVPFGYGMTRDEALKYAAVAAKSLYPELASDPPTAWVAPWNVDPMLSIEPDDWGIARDAYTKVVEVGDADASAG